MGKDHPDWYQPGHPGISHDCKVKTNMSLGDTDVTPPEAFRDPASTITEVGDDVHRYSAIEGRLETREAIVEKWLQSDRFVHHIPVERTASGEPCLIVTPGGQAAMHHAVNAVIEGDEAALLVEPYYPYHAKSVRIFDDTERIETVVASPEDGFQPPLSQVREAVKSKPVGALVLCSPGNPTGTSYDEDWLKGVANIARTYDINVVSDEVYAFLTYEGVDHRSITTYPGMSERTFVVGSFSKVLGISGWRLGFVRCPENYFNPLVDITDSIAMQSATVGQVLLEQALREEESLSSVDRVVQRFQSRMELLVEPFRESEKITVSEPEGAFYLSPTVVPTHRKQITELGGYDDARASLPDTQSVTAGDCLYHHLLTEAEVKGTPGRYFGPAAAASVRLAFGQTSVEEVDAATDRISEALALF